MLRRVYLRLRIAYLQMYSMAQRMCIALLRLILFR
jgi:hypothetical protein